LQSLHSWRRDFVNPTLVYAVQSNSSSPFSALSREFAENSCARRPIGPGKNAPAHTRPAPTAANARFPGCGVIMSGRKLQLDRMPCAGPAAIAARPARDRRATAGKNPSAPVARRHTPVAPRAAHRAAAGAGSGRPRNARLAASVRAADLCIKHIFDKRLLFWTTTCIIPMFAYRPLYSTAHHRCAGTRTITTLTSARRAVKVRAERTPS